MILVNSPGNDTAYAPLEHSEWNGCTPTDLVFPFFVFIVGVSLVFSNAKRREKGGNEKELFGQILRRTLIIFGLGLFLNGFPHYHLSTIRIPGVLQRVALCYFFAATLYLTSRFRMLVLVTAGLLVGYWLLMTRVHIPGFGIGNLSKEGNLAAFVDRTLLSGHIYRTSYDPEGILSTLPAVASALMGVLTGCWLYSEKTRETKTLGLLTAGIACAAAGRVWAFSFPINKALWTSSYVLYTGGLALLLLGACYWLIEIKGIKRWSFFFEALGVNAIAAYVLHILFLKIQNLIHIHGSNGTPVNLRIFITDHLLGSWASPRNASLLYALSYTVFWFLVLNALYKRKIFIKI